MSRVAPLFSWQRALTSEASNATRTERHVGLQVSIYMSAAGDGAWPGNTRLARETGLGKSTVREALRGLDEKGWLTRSINRGRGNTNTYEARVPRSYFDGLEEKEKRHILAVFGLDRLADEQPEGAARTAAPTGSGEDAKAALPAEEKRQTVAVLPTAKSTSYAREKRQETDAKSASGLAPTRTEDQIKTTAAAAAAGAELAERFDVEALTELDARLDELRAGATLRRAAHADPQRALAWLELARTEATRNPGGFLLVGLNSGEWPAARGPASSSPARLRAWVDQTAWQLGRESAHEILDDWDLKLDDGDRAQWHQAIDDVCDEHEAAERVVERGVA